MKLSKLDQFKPSKSIKVLCKRYNVEVDAMNELSTEEYNAEYNKELAQSKEETIDIYYDNKNSICPDGPGPFHYGGEEVYDYNESKDVYCSYWIVTDTISLDTYIKIIRLC